MNGEPRFQGLSLSVWQDIHDAMSLQIDEKASIGLPFADGSGKGSDVAITPSPKNCTGGFLHIQLKPFVPPV